jgi:hypothetical protein
MKIGEQIVLLENALRDLIRDWERFFAGDLKVPPQAKHERIERRLRLLSGETIQRRAEQFKLENLQHRFMAYAANWTRMLREREEGRGRFASESTAAAAAAAPSSNAGTPGTVSTAGSATLYDRYVFAKQERDEQVKVSRQDFEAQIQSQRAKLEKRLGYEVRFDVHVQDGKVKLAARKVESESQEG